MIMVFGGRGFIGGELVELLARFGEEIVVVDNRTLLHTAEEKVVNSPHVEYVDADVRDPRRMEELFLKYEIEKAALLVGNLDVQYGERNAGYDVEVGVLSNVRLLELCAKYKTQKVVFASSCGVYAQNAEMPTPETGKISPVSVYHAGKLATEGYLDYFHRVRGLKYGVVRFGKVYGPRKTEAVSIFAERMLLDKTLFVHGNGKTTRDLLHVKDAAFALKTVLDAPNVGVWNISSGVETSLDQIINALSAMTGKTAKIVYKDMGCHQDRMFLNVRKAFDDLGWTPRVELSEGVAGVVDWLKKRLGV